MFSTNLAYLGKYDYFNDRFKAAYKWLKETNLETIEVGKYDIIPGEVYAMVQEYETEAKETRKFEAHEKFFDIQYIVKGHEMFQLCDKKDLTVLEVKEGKDMILYHDPATCSELTLFENDFIVLAPEEAHKPKCFVDKPVFVKKIVLKVLV